MYADRQTPHSNAPTARRGDRVWHQPRRRGAGASGSRSNLPKVASNCWGQSANPGTWYWYTRVLP